MVDSVKTIFKLNLTLMRLLGFYPPRNFKKVYKIYAYAVYVCLTIPVPTLAAVHLIVGQNIDLAQVAESSCIIFDVGCFIFKMFPFIFNADEIRRTIFMLEQPLFNNYTKEQEVMVQEDVKVCKRNSSIFVGFTLLALVFWSAAPFAGSSHKFPIEIWLPFNTTSDNTTYIFTFVFIFLGVGNGAIASNIIDTLVSGMACLGVTQLRILKNNLERLGIDAEEDIKRNSIEGMAIQEREDLKNKTIYEKIGNCINHHNAILKYIEAYEKVYSPILFSQFMASTLVIGVSILQLSLVEPFTYTFFSMVSFLQTVLVEVFLLCYFGSSLFEESNSLTTAIYMGTWYEYDYKSKKALLVLMERSKKPVVVTAGKIIDLNLQTFTTVLKKSYSLLAVLQNYKHDM